MKLEALSLSEMRTHRSEKWRGFPADVLPLFVAEMDFPIAEPIKDALRDMIDRSDTGYLGPFPELFESYSNFARELWGWQPDISQMRIATDVGVGAVPPAHFNVEPPAHVNVSAAAYFTIIVNDFPVTDAGNVIVVAPDVVISLLTSDCGR